MTSKTVRLLSLIAAVGFWSAALAPAWAEADDPKALAAALKDATATLQGGLKASEREGTPISAKFEIEDGKLQLSVYTMKDDGFMEVVADPKSGAIAKAGWQTGVGEALGKPGAQTPSGVYRVGFPRTDLKVTLDGVALRAGFALGGWLAFEKMGDQGMVMGDLVLTMDEVNLVMTKLAA